MDLISRLNLRKTPKCFKISIFLLKNFIQLNLFSSFSFHYPFFLLIVSNACCPRSKKQKVDFIFFSEISALETPGENKICGIWVNEGTNKKRPWIYGKWLCGGADGFVTISFFNELQVPGANDPFVALGLFEPWIFGRYRAEVQAVLWPYATVTNCIANHWRVKHICCIGIVLSSPENSGERHLEMTPHFLSISAISTGKFF